MGFSSGSKGALTKFALVIYYLLCLAGTGLVAWLGDVLNFHSGTCHLSACLHPAPEKEQQRSRAEVCKGRCVHGQECWSTRLFDHGDCRSVLWNREREESFPLVCSLLQRQACFIHPEQTSECRLGPFKEDQNNNRGLEWEEQSRTKVLFSHCHLAPLPALSAQPKH